MIRNAQCENRDAKRCNAECESVKILTTVASALQVTTLNDVHVYTCTSMRKQLQAKLSLNAFKLVSLDVNQIYRATA